ncbi:hypothetical protein Tco_0592674 [Tanacetum coccineum]
MHIEKNAIEAITEYPCYRTTIQRHAKGEGQTETLRVRKELWTCLDYADLGTFHPLEKFASMLNSPKWGNQSGHFPLLGRVGKLPEAFKAHIYPTLWRAIFNPRGRFTDNQDKVVLDMKVMQEMIKVGVIPFKTDQEILDEVVPSDNRQNMSGIGRKLPGGGSTSCRRANRAYGDVMTRDHMTQIVRQQEQEKELYRKQAEEAQARAYLASLKADAADQRANVAYQNTESIYGALGQFFMHYNSPNSARPFTPPAFSLVPPPPPPMPQLTPNWAHLLQPPFPYNQPLQPLQPPYPGPFPPIPVTNNNFNNCYHPVLNSTHCIPSSSNSQAQRPHYTLLTNPHMNDSRSCDQLAQDLARENNNECSSREEEEEGEQQSGDDYSEEEE